MNRVISVDGNARSRRNFFAQAGALLAAAGVAPNVVNAQSFSSDVDVLNYALRLERLEATFYTLGLAKFGVADFAASNFAKSLTSAQVTAAYGYIQAIQQQEVSHVNQISAAIMGLGGTTAAPDCYGFQPYGGDLKSLATADSFIAVAMLLENTGVMAYDGALSLFQSQTLMTTAATIATVEARHAAYLNQLNGVSPFPAGYDTPATAQGILAAASNYLASCSSFPANAIAGPAGTTTAKNTLQLTAAGSTTAPGLAIVAYTWEVALGSPNASILNPSSATPTVTFLGGPGIYTFSLAVTDSAGNTGVGLLKVTYTGK
jgi:hypothetical protein